ncbi:MAG: phosphatase, partial [Chloroflexi bacterium]|nr:phosphatase [Chloroflexota bacterium]
IVRQALAKGAVALALTDHDTMIGIPMAAPLAEQARIWLVPAVEFNTDAAGLEMDILGYFWRLPQVDWFQHLLESRQKERIRRAHEIINKLNDLGFEISYEQVRQVAKGIVARPHIAQVMVEKGYVKSQKEAYDKYIGFGKPAYAERDELHPIQAIQYVREARGLAVLAHPGLLQQDDLLPDLIKAGLDGLEIYYPEHSAVQIKKY